MASWNKQVRIPVFTRIIETQNGVNTSSFTQGYALPGADIKSGISNVNYKNQIIEGIDATTSYSRSGFKIKPGYFDMSSRQVWGGQNIRSTRQASTVGLFPTLPSLGSSALTEEASARLKRKLRKHTGQSNQLTNVAELRDLPRTVKSVAGSASKLVTAVLHSKKRGIDLQKFAADQWLTWSFGVLPTLAAVDDAVSSVQSYLAREDHRNVEYGSHTEDWVMRTSTALTGSHHAQVLSVGSFHATRSAKITAGFKYTLQSSEDYTLGKHLGFDISSVIPTAWELLPYSWLVDYFTTAGSFLEDTFTADFGQSFYICLNQKLTVIGETTFTPKALFQKSPITSFVTWPCKYEYYSFNRSPLLNLPRAPLRFKTPTEVAHHATTKLLNLTALLRSRN